MLDIHVTFQEVNQVNQPLLIDAFLRYFLTPTFAFPLNHYLNTLPETNIFTFFTENGWLEDETTSFRGLAFFFGGGYKKKGGTLPETNSSPMKIPIIPGKYHQNGGFSMAIC